MLVLLGTCLRLWEWSSQILLDDEWHTINFVSGRSSSEVIIQQGMGANSIPVNIYAWLVLHTTGWSEPMLRLPSLLAGVGALIILPLLVKRIWGGTVALLFQAFLAISPVVIFYSRNIRPYSPAMLLATSSVLLTILWLVNGRRRDILLSAICGSLAIYYHLYTAIPVGLPLIVALAASIRPLAKKTGLAVTSPKPFRDIFLTGLIFVGVDGLFVVVPNALNPWWANSGIHSMDHANIRTLLTVLELLAGSGRLGLGFVVAVLVVAGLLLLLRRNRTVGMALILPFVLFATVMSLTTQDGSHAGIQVARYGLTFFPLAFVAIAVALEKGVLVLRSKLPFFSHSYVVPACALLAWTPFVATSPLWAIYAGPNNFTNHSGYQYRYEPIDWSRSPERDLAPGISIRYEEIPSLYRQPEFLSGVKGIIEYPMPIGDHDNPYFYYQHFHHLPVVIGYTAADHSYRYPFREEWVRGDRMVDYIMSGVPAGIFSKAASWRNMINLEDVAWIRQKYSGWLIVLHTNPVREIEEHIPENSQGFYGSPDLPLTPQVAGHMSDNFGPPLMQNNHIVVWGVR